MTPRPARSLFLICSPSYARWQRLLRRCAPKRLSLPALHVSGLLFSVSLLLLGASSTNPAPTPTIVKGFSLRRFTKEGVRRDTDLRADEARYFTRSELTLAGVTYTIYANDSANRPETVFTTPSATALPDQKILRGEQSVRVVRDDFEVSGEHWIYDHEAKTFNIGENARTVIKATLPDILK